MRGGCGFIALGCLCGIVLALFSVLNLLGEVGGSLAAVTQPGGGGLAPPRQYSPRWALAVIALAVFVLPGASTIIGTVRSKVPVALASIFDIVALGAVVSVVGQVKWLLSIFVLLHLISILLRGLEVRPGEGELTGEGIQSVDKPVNQPTLVRVSDGEAPRSADSAGGTGSGSV